MKAIAVDYINMGVHEIGSSDVAARQPGDIICLLYFSVDPDKVAIPISISVQEAYLMYQDLQKVFQNVTE